MKITKIDEKVVYKNELLDSLNLIDEQAEQMGGDQDEVKARAQAYDLIYRFISKTL